MPRPQTLNRWARRCGIAALVFVAAALGGIVLAEAFEQPDPCPNAKRLECDLSSLGDLVFYLSMFAAVALALAAAAAVLVGMLLED